MSRVYRKIRMKTLKTFSRRRVAVPKLNVWLHGTHCAAFKFFSSCFFFFPERRSGLCCKWRHVEVKGVNRVAVVPEDISYPVPAHWLYRTQHSLPMCVCQNISTRTSY